MANTYQCPKCGSDATIKDRIMGSDTMDRECQSCGYTGIYREFIVEDKDNEDD